LQKVKGVTSTRLFALLDLPVHGIISRHSDVLEDIVGDRALNSKKAEEAGEPAGTNKVYNRKADGL